MDIPGLYGLIWLRRTLSLTIYLQFIGRVLRPAKGKTHGIILDPVGNLFIHGFPEAARQWTLDGAAPGLQDPEGFDDPLPPMRICPYCGVANAASNPECHFCGRDLGDRLGEGACRSRHLPAMVDGNLVAVTSDGQAQAIHERAESIRERQARKNEAAARAIAEGLAPEIASRDARGGYLREGLFSKRRPLFDDAVKNFLK
jgi:superfamily II DNA or RNA helicase